MALVRPTSNSSTNAHNSSKTCTCSRQQHNLYLPMYGTYSTHAQQMERTSPHQQVMGFQPPAFPGLFAGKINTTKGRVQLLLLGSAQQHPLVVQRKIVGRH